MTGSKIVKSKVGRPQNNGDVKPQNNGDVRPQNSINVGDTVCTPIDEDDKYAHKNNLLKAEYSNTAASGLDDSKNKDSDSSSVGHLEG